MEDSETSASREECLVKSPCIIQPTSPNPDAATSTSLAPDSTGTVSTDNEEYVQVVVFLHKPTGYYYDPATQQYLVPMYHPSTAEKQTASSYTQQTHSSGKLGQRESQESITAQSTSLTSDVSTMASVPSAVDTSSEGVVLTTQASGLTPSIDSDEPELRRLESLEKEFKESQKESSNQSISSMLASVSERVMERCGYKFEEDRGMCYQGLTGLFYDQERRLYFDPNGSCYYDYDPDTKCYFLQSRVSPVDPGMQLAREEKRRSQHEVIEISSDSELDSPEEGEIRSPKRPHLPKGSPPPENRWTSCLRVVVTDSNHLDKNSIYIVTVGGANIGREPEGPNVIKVPELAVSKSHAVIGYDRAEHCFTVTDLGSVNGTLLNQDRLSEPKERSKPHTLSHGDTLTLGSTTLTLHIHTGLDTCEGCDLVSLEQYRAESADSGSVVVKQSLDVRRRSELSRIKAKYGLRVRDTFGEQSGIKSGYEDRAELRRKTVGSDLPGLDYPDSLPSSVDRAIEGSNVGHRMLVKMGWSEGSGLGRGEQGQVNPVKAHIRDCKSGLGYEDVSRSLDSTGWESSIVLKSKRMRKRFKELTKTTQV